MVFSETTLRGALCYESIVEAESPTNFHWPSFDENSASSLCYTSGTTGLPKVCVCYACENTAFCYP